MSIFPNQPERSREAAKELLVHYFRIALQKNPNPHFDSDNQAEIESLVDLLIETSKTPLEKERFVESAYCPFCESGLTRLRYDEPPAFNFHPTLRHCGGCSITFLIDVEREQMYELREPGTLAGVWVFLNITWPEDDRG